MLKNIALSTMALTFSFLIFACSESNIPNKDTIVIAISSKPNTLDPRIATDANGMRIAELLFQSLVKLGPQLNIIGDAAESWKYKNLKYTFYLRPNLSFSNGRPLDEEDVRYSFSEYMDPKNIFHSAFKSIDKVTVRKKNSQIIVELKLKKFSATLISSNLPVLKILPKKESLKAGKNFYKNPIGTGLFAFQFQDASKIILKTRLEKTEIKFKKVIFKIIRDDFTRFQKMLKGSIDLAQSEIPVEKVKVFEKNTEKFSVYKYPGLSMNYILVNLKDPHLKNINLRKAIAMAINRDEIIQYKLSGLATKATSILTPSSPFFNKN